MRKFDLHASHNVICRGTEGVRGASSKTVRSGVKCQSWLAELPASGTSSARGGAAPCGWRQTTPALRESRRSLRTTILRPRLAGLHFTSEAIFFCFSSTNSSTGGAEAVLVNRLAKWLPCESMFLGAWRRSREKPLFLAPSHPKLCESTFLGASSVEPFHFTPFSRKRLQTAPEAAGEAQSRK